MDNATHVTLVDELENKSHIIYTVTGVSMMPLLRQNRDLVVIEKLVDVDTSDKTEISIDKLKVGDAVLFRRGDKLVLHRIIEIRGDDYIIMGDNQYVPELVRRSQLLGVMTSIVRDGEEIKVTDPNYQKYVKRTLALSIRERRIKVRHMRLKTIISNKLGR